MCPLRSFACIRARARPNSNSRAHRMPSLNKSTACNSFLYKNIDIK